jgi:2-polyprenyl-3-methyl-5-hydroxy-6-metoxy-1,4-benzoquinol methylase
VFLAARLVVLPLGALERELRALDGRVLSLGGGHGLLSRWLVELSPGASVEDLELDPARVQLARETAVARVEPQLRDVRDLSEVASFDGAVAIDVLHHIPAADHAGVAAALARALRPGATLVVKDIARTPRWRHAWNRLHDRLVAGSEPIWCRDPEEMTQLFEQAGFQPELVTRLAPLSPYPHYLLRMRRR